MVDAWNHLTGKVRHRTTLLDDSDEYYKFCIAVQDQLSWMNDMQRQILTYDKSRCVLVWYGIGMVWCESVVPVWCYMLRCCMVWCGIVCYSMVFGGMVWYGVV